MKKLTAIFVLGFVIFFSHYAVAVINIFGPLKFTQQISVRNNTDNPVSFVRGETICAAESPDSFTVAPHASATISVLQKHWDTGLDNCYATHHVITYNDSNNAKNNFRIIQYDNSNQYACLDIKFNAIIWLNQAICPEANGSVFGPVNSEDGLHPVSCPEGADNCPPTDNGSDTEYFGFAIQEPSDFSVVLDNESGGELDCNFTDLSKKTDRNECVINQPTVDPGKTKLVLKGSCADNFYRIGDRTNVQLLCYASGTNAAGLKIWTSVTNGTKYVYTTPPEE